jgi:hypothetical protein
MGKGRCAEDVEVLMKGKTPTGKEYESQGLVSSRALISTDRYRLLKALKSYYHLC